jgi:hypothetical protein
MASPTKLSLELRNMMQAWADQEEQERDRSSKRGNDYNNNNKQGNDHRSDKSQRDYSGSSRKGKPNDPIAAIECPPRVKKSRTTQEQFNKLSAQAVRSAPKRQALGNRVLQPLKDLQCPAS